MVSRAIVLINSSDKSHEDWVDLLKIEWGVGRNITSKAGTKGDRESANAQTTELKIYKLMDKATPKIFMDSCCGVGKIVTIELTKTGTGQGADTYMQYLFHDALFSNYHVRHRNNKHPLEFITLNYTKLEQRYIQHDDSNTPLSPIAVGFDTAINTML